MSGKIRDYEINESVIVEITPAISGLLKCGLTNLFSPFYFSMKQNIFNHGWPLDNY